MKTVTVALEDLEALVFATGAIKNIEGALASFKQDPFVKPYLTFTDAHNRCATAMRNAKRADADTLIKFDEPLTDEEREILAHVNEYDAMFLSPREKAPKAGQQMSIYDQLAAKGCVVIAQCLTGFMWAGASAPEIKIDPKGFAVKLTDRGRQKLKE